MAQINTPTSQATKAVHPSVEQQMAVRINIFLAIFGALLGGLLGNHFLAAVAGAIALPLGAILLDLRNETVAVVRELEASA